MSLKTSLCVSTPAPEFPSTLTSRSSPPVTRHRLRPLCLFKPQLSLHSVLPVGWSCAEFPCEWFLHVCFFFFVLCCCVWIQILVIEVCILSPLWSVVTKPPLQKLKNPKEFFFFFLSQNCLNPSLRYWHPHSVCLCLCVSVSTLTQVIFGWVAFSENIPWNVTKKQITLTESPPCCEQRGHEKVNMNMQIDHRAVSACLKNCCLCFLQLIAQTTACVCLSVTVHKSTPSQSTPSPLGSPDDSGSAWEI